MEEKNKKLKLKLKNAHCVYFEGQTGLCQAKEFKKCNPINCKLYTIDELSTILDLQNKLEGKDQECKSLNLKIDALKFEIDKILCSDCTDFKTLKGKPFEYWFNLEKENEKLKIQLMQKSEVDTFFNTPIEGWDNDPCKICRHKQTLDIIKYMAENNDRCNSEDILDIIEQYKDKNKCQCSCDECGAECEPFYKTNKTIQEVKHLLSTGQRASISTKTFEKIIELSEQKEQECEELKKDCPKRCKSDKYKQVLDEVEEFCLVYSDNHDAYETVYKHILDIINKAKDNK